MDVRPGRRTDALLHHVDEGGHIVVRDLLALQDVGDEDLVDGGGLGPAAGGVLGRHHTECGLGLRSEQLDLEPEGEARRVAEQRRHVRRRVARDHRVPSPAPTGESDTRAAMSWRICMPSHSIGAAAA